MAAKPENREAGAAVVLLIVGVLTIGGGIVFAIEARSVGLGFYGIVIAASAAFSGVTLIAFANLLRDMRSAAVDLAALRDKLAPKE